MRVRTPYATILDIHGGPVGSSPGVAANGYDPGQPTGSISRGQDFIRAIQDTSGITDYRDVVGAVEPGIMRVN